MIKQTKALKLALEALEDARTFTGAWPTGAKAITAIRKALTDHIPDATKMVELAQHQEPFGYFKAEPFGWTDCAETDEGAIALYERPPASKPLTDEEIEEVWRRVEANDFHDCVQPFARAIEAKLKEKNT